MAVITLLYKKNDPSQPKNYRPIALLNLDLKIFTKILTYRLNGIIPDLIHPDQRGFVKGRRITENITFFENLRFKYKNSYTQAYATFLDFEKAYDRVNWAYIRRLLHSMGFGPRFILTIKVLYWQSRSQLIINGKLSKPFRNGRGVKQGDPLSPLLFILSLEPLGNLLRANTQCGIPHPSIPHHKQTAVFFADDSTIVTPTLEALAIQRDIVRVYERGSGARLNDSKSIILPLNPLLPVPDLPANLSAIRVLRDSESCSFLGVTVGIGISKSQQLSGLLEMFKTKLNKWKHYARTVQGRVSTIRTMVCSVLYYLAQVLPFEDSFINKLRNLAEGAMRGMTMGSNLQLSHNMKTLPRYWLYASKQDGGFEMKPFEYTFKNFEFKLMQDLVQSYESRFDPNSSHADTWWELNWNRNLFLHNTHILWWSGQLSKRNTYWKDINPTMEQLMKVWRRLEGHVVLRTQSEEIHQEVIQSLPVWFIQTGTTNQPLFRRFKAQEYRARLMRMIQLGYTRVSDFMRVNGEPTTKWTTMRNRKPVGVRSRTWNTISTAVRYIQQYYSQHIIIDPEIRLPVQWWIAWPALDISQPLSTLTRSRRMTVVKQIFPEFQRLSTVTLKFPPQSKDAWRLESHGAHLISPHTANVVYQLQRRLLITNDRFAWKSQANDHSPVTQCPYHSCTATETYEHCFWECRIPNYLWRKHCTVWNSALLQPIKYYDIVFLDNLQFQPPLKQHTKILRQFLQIIRSIVLYHIWKARNYIFFEDVQLLTDEDYRTFMIQTSQYIQRQACLHFHNFRKEISDNDFNFLWNTFQDADYRRIFCFMLNRNCTID